MTKSNNLYKINSHPKYRSYGGGNTRTYTSNKSTGTLGFQEVEVGNMSMDYITRPEFEQHEKNMNNRFDSLDNSNSSIEENVKEGKKELKEAIRTNKSEILELVDNKIEANINKMKETQTKWFIVTILAILGLAGRIFGLY
ncbi:hypothetical protein [Staphylococcus nepalensis]|uniref:hypothetical protein n=1 Tax=Staphylococcus nepalensis TaxID=214473 RepID=UPI003CFBAC04